MRSAWGRQSDQNSFLFSCRSSWCCHCRSCCHCCCWCRLPLPPPPSPLCISPPQKTTRARANTSHAHVEMPFLAHVQPPATYTNPQADATLPRSTTKPGFTDPDDYIVSLSSKRLDAEALPYLLPCTKSSAPTKPSLKPSMFLHPPSASLSTAKCWIVRCRTLTPRGLAALRVGLCDAGWVAKCGGAAMRGRCAMVCYGVA